MYGKFCIKILIRIIVLSENIFYILNFMKNPIIKKLIVIGIRKNDEIEYFENPNSFIENIVDFPLNTVNNIDGIYLARFENFMKLHYI